MKKQDKSLQKKENRGPKPDHLKINGLDWGMAIDKSLKKKRPKEGWPLPEKKKKK